MRFTWISAPEDATRSHDSKGVSPLELYTPDTVPDFGYNGSVAFGFRVDDIEAASAAVAAAGNELLGEINRVPELNYAYRHFKAPNGIVYGLNEQK